MSRTVKVRPLTPEAFAPFGRVIEAAGEPDTMINRGRCGRWHDLARPSAEGGAVAISVARSEPVTLPMTLDLMERHPLGSQAFVPMAGGRLVVTVAPDEDGTPGAPVAFLTAPWQGIHYHPNTWHGVLAPLGEAGAFLIVDRVGDGDNLVEHPLDPPWTVAAP